MARFGQKHLTEALKGVVNGETRVGLYWCFGGSSDVLKARANTKED